MRKKCAPSYSKLRAGALRFFLRRPGTKRPEFGYRIRRIIGDDIWAPSATGPGVWRVLPLVTKIITMKNNLSFHLLAAVIIAGVVVAFAAPPEAPRHPISASPAVVATPAAGLAE